MNLFAVVQQGDLVAQQRVTKTLCTPGNRFIVGGKRDVYD